MTALVLRQTRIKAGLWEGILTGAENHPQLEVLHLETALESLTVTAIAGSPGHWGVVFSIPVQTLTEGVQTFVFRDKHSGAHLTHFTMITGASLDGDIRAELDLLRAELDLLKRAFRRHCVETAG